MPGTIYTKQQQKILELFRKKAVYTRDDICRANLTGTIYANNETLFTALNNLAMAGFIHIRRVGNSTIRKRAIAVEYRLSLNGLDYLANVGEKSTPPDMPAVQGLAHRQKKPRRTVKVNAADGEMQQCGMVMRVCYQGGCYMRQYCTVYKGNW